MDNVKINITIPENSKIAQTIKKIKVLQEDEYQNVCIRIAELPYELTSGKKLAYPEELNERLTSEDSLSMLGVDEIIDFPDAKRMQENVICLYDIEEKKWLYFDIVIITGIFRENFNTWWTTSEEEIIVIDSRYDEHLHELQDDGSIKNRTEILEFLTYHFQMMSNIRQIHYSYSTYYSYLEELIKQYAEEIIFEDFPLSYDAFKQNNN